MDYMRSFNPSLNGKFTGGFELTRPLPENPVIQLEPSARYSLNSYVIAQLAVLDGHLPYIQQFSKHRESLRKSLHEHVSQEDIASAQTLDSLLLCLKTHLIPEALIAEAKSNIERQIESMNPDEISANLANILPYLSINGQGAVSYTHLTLPTILLV